jgi:disulfide bond formation protein DsbB
MTPRGALVYLAWWMALIATIGSLYFSEVRMFVPCTLCWWQRIFMYPLVVVLGVANFRQDLSVWRTALPLSVVGWGIASYHYLVQKVPGLAAPASCAAGAPCNMQYINWFGFITIPFLAGTAFLVITLLMLQLARGERAESKATEAQPA